MKLYPYLTNATADGRRDMWKTMVVPLFNPVLMLCNYVNSVSHIRKTERLLLATFKRYLIIPKTTSSELVSDMMGDNFGEIMERLTHNAAEKWVARREDREPENLMPKKKYTNYLKGVPNTWCEILKQQCRVCHICKKSNRNAQHMEEAYQVQITSYKEIWLGIEEYHDYKE